MADTVSSKTRSSIMAAIRSSGNFSTEQKFIGLLKTVGARGWRRGYPLYGRPDFVFLGVRTAIFIDGCFWHGCKKHHRSPTSNREYWTQKISLNRIRDRKTTKYLRAREWIVLRIWEHELRKEHQRVLVRRLSRYLHIADSSASFTRARKTASKKAKN
ncbi:very short patch repair endonuclease [Horticoccus sp. 23ND18S-11]|uniref:very short patch repair endonuclease n=1 Tax=Horticoccus sp. 23ND18S-11 TaxID=3391832 RepID=UPI0039C8C5A1